MSFEGTGAVSSWRLELNGRPGVYDINDLVDVTIEIQYTADQGGEAFAEVVKGMLKPYDAVRYFDMGYDFTELWQEWLASEDPVLELPLSGMAKKVLSRRELLTGVT